MGEPLKDASAGIAVKLKHIAKAKRKQVTLFFKITTPTIIKTGDSHNGILPLYIGEDNQKVNEYFCFFFFSANYDNQS